MRLFINGVRASEFDWVALKRDLRAGKVKVISRPIVNKEIHLITIDYGWRSDMKEPFEESFGSDYFENRSCPYYPCHNLEHINCLFCVCPLYPLKDCGGNYHILENGVKDCSKCVYPHIRENYPEIQELLALLCKTGATEKRWRLK